MEIRAVEFGKRLAIAVSNHPSAPNGMTPLVLWLQGRLMWRFKSALPAEVIEAWCLGQSVPADGMVEMLAELLGVDYFWLRAGERPPINQ